MAENELFMSQIQSSCNAENTNADQKLPPSILDIKTEILDSEDYGEVNNVSIKKSDVACVESLKQEEIEHQGNLEVESPNSNLKEEMRNKVFTRGEDETFKSCNQCSYQTKHNHNLNRHLIKLHEYSDKKKRVKLDIFKCSRCKFQTNNADSYSCHIGTHNSNLLFQCDFCSFNCKYKSGILKHIRSQHSDQLKEENLIYKCRMCSYETMWRSDLKKHGKVHLKPDEIQTYKCNDCDFESEYKNSLIQHVLKHQSLEKLLTFKCKFCPYISKWKSCLTRHLKIHLDPKQGKDYKCEFCSYQSNWLSCLKKHVKNKHQAPKEKEYKCQLCEFTSKNIRNFNNHQKIHLNPEKKTFNCAECPFVTFYRDRIKEHVLLHKSGLLFQCKLCSYQSTSQVTLERHQKTHKKHELSIGSDKIPTLSCNYCPYETKWKDELIQHLKCHNINKRKFYFCEECAFKTPHKPNLRYHTLLNHLPNSKLRIFKCEFCPYASLYQGNLNKHLRNCRKYLGEAPGKKPFQCGSCNFETFNRKSLKNHKKRHVIYEAY